MSKTPENFIFKQLNQDITTTTTGDVLLVDVDDMVAGTASDPQKIVLSDSLTSPTKFEIVHYTTINTITKAINIVSRGEEGTTQYAFSTGDYAYQAVTNEFLNQFVLVNEDNAFTGENSFNKTYTGGTTTVDFLKYIDGGVTALQIGLNGGSGYVETMDNAGSTRTMLWGGDIIGSYLDGFTYRHSIELHPLSAELKLGAAGYKQGRLELYGSATGLVNSGIIEINNGGSTYYLYEDSGDLKFGLSGSPTSLVGGRYYNGATSSSGPGTQSITGVGFTPKLVKIHAYYQGGGSKSLCVGSGTSSSTCQYIINDYGPGLGVSGTTTGGSTIVAIYAGTTSPVEVAALQSLDSDGFTLNWTTTTGTTMNIFYECFA